MAIVGTAFVRLRVIGDKLKNDIAKATSESVEASAPSLKTSGEEVGEKISDGIGESLSKSVGSKMGKVADEIGDAIGKRMAENMGRSLRRRAGDSLTRGFSGIQRSINTVGQRAQGAWDSVSSLWAKKTGSSFGRNLRGALVGAVAFAVTALPSALAFTGAIAGALVATLIPAIGMIGPAAAGAAIAALAAFSTIKISAGLLGIAMKTETAALEDFQERMQRFKDSIGRPIQLGLLSGFNAALRIAQPIITAIQPQLREMGFVVGDIAIGFANAFREASMLERLQRILTVNNDALKLGGAGVTAFAQAFAVLLDHLSPFILYLASGVRDLGEWANRSILAAEASGQLDTWLNRMFTAMTRFVGVLVDFGVGIFNVFRAASGESQSMFTSLEGIAARFREWTGDAANQERMAAFFSKMRIITSEVLDILGRLAVASGRALEGTDTSSVINGLNTLVTVAKAVGGIFEDIRASAGPQLTEAFRAFADMMTDLAESGVIGHLAGAFALLFNAISQLLNIPGFAQILSLVLGLKALLTVVKVLMPVLKLGLLVFRLFSLAISILVGAFGIIPVIIGAVVLALLWFFTQTELGRQIVAAVWEFIKNAISAAVDGIVAAWDWMVAAFRKAWDWVTDIATGIWKTVKGAFDATVGAVSTALATVQAVITRVWGAIWGFISPIINGIWSLITTVFNGIVTAIQTYLNILWEIWIRVWPLLALPIRVLIGVIIFAFQAFYENTMTIFNAVWAFLKWIWEAIAGAIGATLDWISGKVSTAWDWIAGKVSAVMGWISDKISAVWDWISNKVGSAMDWVSNKVGAAWDWISGKISGVADWISGKVSGAWNAMTGAIGRGMDWAQDKIGKVWDWITDKISGALDFISGLVSSAWDAMGDLGGGIVDGLKKALNTIIDGVNVVIGGLNSAIDLANKLPGPDISNIPKIPRLAKGGIISPTGGGTLALVAEAGRSERVEPLDPQGLSRRDRAMIEMLAGSSGGGTPANVHVYLGVRELTELVDIVVEEREDDLAGRVLTGTKG